jgi:putative ABC transport system permease protein
LASHSDRQTNLRAGWAIAARLARRELRAGVHGFRIFLACIALGVAAITAVGWVSEAMLAGLRHDGQSILGGDLEVHLRHREIEPEQRAWLADHGELSAITEMRTMTRAGTPAGGGNAPAAGERRLVELRAVDEAYPLYGSVGLEPALPIQDALAERDGVWGAVAEAALLDRLGLAPGDYLEVGGLAYRVRAVLVDEPDKISHGFAFGPGVLVARSSLAETDLIQPGSLISYHYRLRVPPGTDVPALRDDLCATTSLMPFPTPAGGCATPGRRRRASGASSTGSWSAASG